MSHKLQDNFFEQIDGIACLKAGFPSLKAGTIKAVNMLKEQDLRWKISDNEIKEELSQERAIQMPISQKAVEMCIELLAKIAVGNGSALKQWKNFYQKGEPALIVSAFFKQQGEALNMFTDEEWFLTFIDSDIVKQ